MIRSKPAAVSCLALLIAACSGPQLDKPAPLPLPPANWSTETGISEEAPTLDWWTELGEPELDRLVELALQNNADLRAASANLKATRALVGEARAAKLPIGSVDASLTRSRTAGASLQLDTVGGPEVLPSQTLIDAGVSLNWEIDLAGRIAAAEDAAVARAEQETWARRGVEALVATSVVRAWVDLAECDQRLALLSERRILLADIAARLGKAYKIGGIRHDDLVEAERATRALDGERLSLENARRNALRRLATLTGTPAPDGVRNFANLITRGLPAPQFVRAGNPERILRLRPDVAAAEQELVQAMARIKIAQADLYPRFSLFGSAGVSAVPGRVTDEGALRFGIGPMLSWGLFDMGRIRARIRAEGAAAEAAGARWEASFMRALEETDAALDLYDSAKKTALVANKDLALATQLADFSATRHRAGEDSYLKTAISRDARLVAANDALRADTAALSAWIDVQTALGAGWRN